MSSPRADDVADATPLRVRLVRLVSLGVALAAVAGLIITGLESPPAVAAADDSAITVDWTGDAGPAAALQPTRNSSSPHFGEFDQVEVAVSQTRNLGDQAIRVTVSGMPATVDADDDGGQNWSSAMNFVQAMQCWGDPADAGFRETCQWGGRYAQNNGLGATVYRDNVMRVAASSMAPDAAAPVDVPFRTFGGTAITGREVWALDGNGQPTTARQYPLLTYMSPATTNEVQGARMSTGATTFDFETQSSDQAPQLGCGREGHLRCYLVLVPRGSRYGGQDASCSYIADNNGLPFSYGRAGSIQAGSPLNPGCDYWDNRVVVPLDFTPTGVTCPSGASERAVIGSQLLIGAMASWQPYLCNKIGSTFNFTANPDSIARLQLLDGDAGLAFGSFPIVKAELDDPLAEAAFDDTAVSYAPVAIGAGVLGYFADGPEGRIQSLRLSPRLVAKLLTQSYGFLVPRSSAEPQKNIAHLGAVNRSYEYLRQDPDFQRLNPTNWQKFSSNPAIVIPGPSGADALRQLWKWILADDEAKRWLGGEADPDGMTVNPYFLPKGHPNAKVPMFDGNGDPVLVPGTTDQQFREVGLSNPDSTPMKISEQLLDRFLKVDESEVPLKLALPNQSRFGSLQAFPYVESLAAGARIAFRADPGAKTVWDPAKVNAAGQPGDWVSSGSQIPGQRFMIAVTDLASADRFALDTASLRLSNRSEFGDATVEQLTASLAALTPTAVSAVKQVDPAAVASGYPLTTVVYATVNLTDTDARARRDFGGLIREVTTRGQTPGTAVGDLPPGYLPLTGDLKTQAAAAAAAIESYVAPTPSPSNGIAQDDFEDGGFGDDGSGDGGDGVDEPEVTDLGEVVASRTPAPEAMPIGQAGLAIALGIGVAGAVFAPLLFRGRGLL